MPDAHDTESDARDDATARAGAPGALAERRWSFVAGACLVAAVLGVVVWLWDQRNRIRAGIIEDGTSEEGRDELEEFDDEGGRDAGRRRGDEI